MKFIKTEAGQLAFKTRSPQLSARQRSAFILFDGSKTNDQVLVATSGLGITQSDIDHLLEQGFLVATAPAPAPVAATAAPKVDKEAGQAPSNGLSKQQRYVEAMRMATQLTAGLGLRGFRLNLALEAATGYDGLVAMLPRIKEAVGETACQPLEHMLKG